MVQIVSTEGPRNFRPRMDELNGTVSPKKTFKKTNRKDEFSSEKSSTSSTDVGVINSL